LLKPELNPETQQLTVEVAITSNVAQAITSNVAQAITSNVAQAIANLRHADTSLRYYAAWWLGKFRVQSEVAVTVLIECLEDEDDRTELGGYPLRRNAARALGKIGDDRAVPGLIACLECSDFYVRESAAEALGQLKDNSCIPALMKLLQGGVASAQLEPGQPHLKEPCEAVMEALGNLGATEAVELIQPFLDHSQLKVISSAARAMYQLTQNDTYAKILVRNLKGNDIKLRRVALRDLGDIGYLPAAEAIATAATEGSFKLIALKGLLEHQLELEVNLPLSQKTIDLMTLMDNLI